MEEWQTIIMTPKYECSNLGKVRNKNNKRTLKYKTTPDGYLKTSLTTDTGNRIIQFTHRLVAITWIENPENKPTVDHINGKRDDNRVVNLRFATHKEQYANIPKENRYKNSGKYIWKCDKDTGEKLELYDNIKKAAISINETTKQSFNNISKCANNKKKEAYGFKWKFDFPEGNEDEEWKLYAENNDNKYYISSYGRVKNNNRLLKIGKEGGYDSAYVDKKTQKCHIMVAKAFIPNPNNYPIVNHKDGNKLNNNVKNLEYVTVLGNVQHAIENGLNPLHKKVVNYDNNGNILDVYLNCADAGRKLNVNKSSVHKCCINLIQTCGKNKLTFKYLEDGDDIENKKVLLKEKEQKEKFDMAQFSRKVINYDDSGNILNVYTSVKEAAKELTLCESTIHKCCGGSRKTCKKKKFKYLDDNDNLNTMKIGEQKSDIVKISSGNLTHQKIEVYNKEGVLLETCDNKEEVAKKYKVNVDTVRKHCYGRTKHTNLNYIFKHAQ